MQSISKELQREAEEYRGCLYQDSPGVELFVKVKKIFLSVLACLLIIHLIIEASLIAQEFVEFSFLPSELRKILFHLVLLWVALMGTWKAGLWLYLIAVPSAAVLVLYWETTVWALTSGEPLITLLTLCDIIYTAGLIVLAVWLTLFPKSRRNGNRAREIRREYLGYINDRLPGNQSGL